MRRKALFFALSVLLLVGGLALPGSRAGAADSQAELVQTGSVSAYQLILAMNTLRVSNGLPALIEDPIVNAVAQTTAEIMAANEMSWHIGDVRGRIQAAGYGGGATVWATENFAVGLTMGIDEIMLAWADPDHMRPATNPAYCHVGAGVARAANGRTYYILQAAYTDANACGPYEPPPGDGNPGAPAPIPVPQIIIPVKVATPDIDGKIYHVVRPGQSFWSIAVAYQITIKDLEFWNNLSRENDLWVGQRLFIPSRDTVGYATPTPVGMVVPSLPDAEGKIIHTVEAYHTLITISRAYAVPVDRILVLNGIQVDWPLQIGQELIIYPGDVTPTPTPRPLTPIERLTPASDGKYYHTVASGETLSWIAGYYGVPLTDLMGWNGLTASSIIRPEQKLWLAVTPPATATPLTTPTLPPTGTHLPVTATPTPTPSLVPLAPTTPVEPAAETAGSGQLWMLGVVLSVIGFSLFVGIFVSRKSVPVSG